MGSFNKRLLAFALTGAMFAASLPMTAQGVEAAPDFSGKTLVTEKDRESYQKYSADVSDIEDPAIIRSGDKYYIFGSYLTAAVSDDLINWESFSGEDFDNTLLDRSIYEEFLTNAYGDTAEETVNVTKLVDRTRKHAFGTYDAADWIKGDNSRTVYGHLWTPDVIYNPVMEKYCMYLSVGGKRWNSVIVLLTADDVEGPYTYQGPVVYSGFTSDTESPYSYTKTDVSLVYGRSLDDKLIEDRYGAYNADEIPGSNWGTYYPNAVDPDVVFDENGDLYMTYGSWNGGIYMLKLDAATGLRDYTVEYKTFKNYNTDNYFGVKIAGGCGVSGEGSCIEKIGDYWYLFVSYGDYGPDGGYEMRVFRSDSLMGPYVDQNGNSAVYDKYILNYGYGAQEDRGQKPVSAYRMDFMTVGETGQGQNSVLKDDDGNIYLVYYSAFADDSETYEVKVHNLYVTREGWLSASPMDHDAYTSVNYEKLSAEEIAGEYEIIEGSYDLDYANYECALSDHVILTEDGKVLSGDEEIGSWTSDENGYAAVNLRGNIYSGGFIHQYYYEPMQVIPAFTGNQTEGNAPGVSLWMISAPDDKYVVACNMDYDFPVGTSVNLTLSEIGEYDADIYWTSSDPAVITDGGLVNRDKEDKLVTLTRTVVKGDYYYQKEYPVTVFGTAGENADLVLAYDSLERGDQILPAYTLNADTGACISFTERGINSYWTNVLESDIGYSLISLPYLAYNGGGVYAHQGVVSEYAASNGYSPQNASNMFTDGGEHRVTISFNASGTVDLYRDGNLMLTFEAETKAGSYRVSSAAAGLIGCFANGEMKAGYDLTDFTIGFASDKKSSVTPVEPDEDLPLAVVGKKNENGTYSLEWNDLTKFFRMDAPEGDFQATVNFHQSSLSLPMNGSTGFAVAMETDLNAEKVADDGSAWYLRADQVSDAIFKDADMSYDTDLDRDYLPDNITELDVDMVITRCGSDILVAAEIINEDGMEFHTTSLSCGSPTAPLAVYLGGEDVQLTVNSATMDALTLSKEPGEDIIAEIGHKNHYSLDEYDYSSFYRMDAPEGDFTRSVVFWNSSSGATDWDNFALGMTTDLEAEVAGNDDWYLRSDTVSENIFPGSEVSCVTDIDPTTFRETMMESTVLTTVRRVGTTIKVIMMVRGEENGEMLYSVVTAKNAPTDALAIFLGGSDCVLEVGGKIESDPQKQFDPETVNAMGGYEVDQIPEGDFNREVVFTNVSSGTDLSDNCAIELRDENGGIWRVEASGESTSMFTDAVIKSRELSYISEEDLPETVADSLMMVFADREDDVIDIGFQVYGFNGKKYILTVTAENCPTGPLDLYISGKNYSLGICDYEFLEESIDIGKYNEDCEYALYWEDFENFFSMDAPDGDFEAVMVFATESKVESTDYSFAPIFMKDEDSLWYSTTDVDYVDRFKNSTVLYNSNIYDNWEDYEGALSDAEVVLKATRAGGTISFIAAIDGQEKSYQLVGTSFDSIKDVLKVMLGGDTCIIYVYGADIRALNRTPIKNDIAKATVTVTGEFTEDGTAKTPEPVVTFGEWTLKKDRDYTLSYSNNILAGDAIVTVTGIGNFSGSKDAVFKINKKADPVNPDPDKPDDPTPTDPDKKDTDRGSKGGSSAGGSSSSGSGSGSGGSSSGGSAVVTTLAGETIDAVMPNGNKVKADVKVKDLEAGLVLASISADGSEVRYILDSATGVPVTDSTLTLNGSTYITDANGIVQIGFYYTKKGNLVYGDPEANGALKKNEVFVVDTHRYKALKSGKIVVNSFYTTNRNNQVYTDANGQIIAGRIFLAADRNRYYSTRSGKVVMGKWITYKGKKYYCSKATGKITKKK